MKHKNVKVRMIQWHVTMSMSKIKSDTDVERYYRKTKTVNEEGEGVLSLNTSSVKEWLR